jgi:hypothetical protein
MGILTLERILGVPDEHLQFPIWYMRQHGWIEALDTGQLAITVDGIDRLIDKRLAIPEDRLLPDGSDRDETDGTPRLPSEDGSGAP